MPTIINCASVTCRRNTEPRPDLNSQKKNQRVTTSIIVRKLYLLVNTIEYTQLDLFRPIPRSYRFKITYKCKCANIRERLKYLRLLDSKQVE